MGFVKTCFQEDDCNGIHLILHQTMHQHVATVERNVSISSNQCELISGEIHRQRMAKGGTAHIENAQQTTGKQSVKQQRFFF